MRYQVSGSIVPKALPISSGNISVLAHCVLLSREKQAVRLKEMGPVAKRTTEQHKGGRNANKIRAFELPYYGRH